MNAVLLKELRQSVRNRYVLAAYIIFIVALLIVAGVQTSLSVRESWGNPQSVFRAGKALFLTIHGIFAALGILFIPAYVLTRIIRERWGTDLDLMYVTPMSPSALLLGKFGSAMALAGLFLSAALPFLALSYFIGGIDVLSIVMSVILTLEVIAIATLTGIMIAIAPMPKVLRGVAQLGCALGMVGVAQLWIWGTYALCGNGYASIFGNPDTCVLLLESIAAGLSAAGLLYAAALAGFRPPTAERMRPFRILATALIIAWGVIAAIQPPVYFSALPREVWIQTLILFAAGMLIVGLSERADPLRRRPSNLALSVLGYPFRAGQLNAMTWALLLLAAGHALGHAIHNIIAGQGHTDWDAVNTAALNVSGYALTLHALWRYVLRRCGMPGSALWWVTGSVIVLITAILGPMDASGIREIDHLPGYLFATQVPLAYLYIWNGLGILCLVPAYLRAARARFALGMLVGLLAVMARAEVEVRVRNTPGGPQIHVDGEPVPPRFFFGVERAGAIRVTPEWQSFSFDIVPEVDVAGNGTLHVRFALENDAQKNDAGVAEAWLADMRLTDAEDGREVVALGSFAGEEAFRRMWGVWPPDGRNTVAKLGFEDGCVKVLLNAPPGGQPWPDYHFHTPATLSVAKGRVYRCTFRARGSAGVLLNPALHSVTKGKYLGIGGAPGPFLPQVALARDAGVRLVSFDTPLMWGPPEEEPYWGALDAMCRRIIAVNPRALLLPRVTADAPAWWLARHPEARMAHGDGQEGARASVSDRRYRKDACAFLARVARHLCEAFPDNFAGIHPCGQNTGEWFYQDAWNRMSGYDPATAEAFRAWQKEEGVAEAYIAKVPSPEQRRQRPGGFLRDPAAERRVVDFALFQQEEMASFVAEMARTCREATGGKKLVVFFYGYGFEFAAVPGGAAQSGHYALWRLLLGDRNRRDIDILCSPNAYSDRTWLGSAPVMSAAETVMNAGILWLNEDDTRTHLDTRKQEVAQEGTIVNLRQTQDILLRNTAQAALRGFGTWWMDLPGQGWFNDAELWREMKRLRPVDEAMLKRPAPFTPEIAVIIDEASMCHLTRGTGLVHQRGVFGCCGAPYGQYLLADVFCGNNAARMKIILAAWHLYGKQRGDVFYLRQRDDMRVWCWVPGYLSEEGADVNGIGEVTGFKAKPVALKTAEVTPTRMGREHGVTQPWGERTEITPLFSVEASEAEVWATYADGSPAVAVRKAKRGWDVFIGTPALTPELLHALAKVAGVHLYAKPGTVLWAANGYLATQAQEDGEVAFDMGQGGAVIDALDGAPVSDTPRFTIPMRKGEVRVFQIRNQK
ncbi:MAG: hypothetical protein FWG50_08760 [Kiritimatiellaeota bacterium]|nr:hypothetical protein [Kiritimatiellota bacterium]